MNEKVPQTEASGIAVKRGRLEGLQSPPFQHKFSLSGQSNRWTLLRAFHLYKATGLPYGCVSEVNWSLAEVTIESSA
jgi:hypothetical protein